MKTESEKCAEVFRVGPGQFTFYCVYCTEQFEMHYEAIDHIENHFAYSQENTNSKINDEITKEEIDYGFEHAPELSISPISFTNILNRTDEIKTEPDLVIPEEIFEPKKTAVKKPKCNRKKYDKSDRYSKWGFVSLDDIVECSICQRKTKKRVMRSHLLQHTGIRFSCDICQKQFPRKGTLKDHLSVHSGNKDYFCHICPSRFRKLGGLNEHLLRHTGEQKYECKVCEKSFRQSSTLNVHMRIHTGERPFYCEKCNKSFRTSSNYHAHKRRHMQQERNFKCNTCELTFTTKYAVRYHIMTHTGERPFSCDVCNAAFLRRSQYNQHILLHSDKKPYKCRFCDLCFFQAGGRRFHEKKVHNDICRYKKIANII